MPQRARRPACRQAGTKSAVMLRHAGVVKRNVSRNDKGRANLPETDAVRKSAGLVLVQHCNRPNRIAEEFRYPITVIEFAADNKHAVFLESVRIGFKHIWKNHRLNFAG